MNQVALLIILLAAVPTALSQSAQRVIIWGGDKNCGFKSRSFAETDTISCGSVQSERGTINTVSLNHIGLAVAFLEEDGFEIVAAKITNKGMTPLVFDADNWGAAHFRSVEDFAKGKKPFLAETSIPSRDLVRAASSGVLMANAVENLVAEGQMTAEVREVRRPDGTRVRRTFVVPDKAARQTAADSGRARSDAAAEEMRKLRTTALTAKSVAADGFVKGLVYFRRVKKAGLVVFSLTVDGTAFVFRLPRKR